jgi:hypothetical protein
VKAALTSKRRRTSLAMIGDRSATNHRSCPITLARIPVRSPDVRMNTIINSIRLYRGTGIPGITGRRVVVLSVQRGDETLNDDAQIGGLVRGDQLDVAAIINKPDGTRRVSWSTADARPEDLGPVLGVWDGDVETGILLQRKGGIDGIVNGG